MAKTFEQMTPLTTEQSNAPRPQPPDSCLYSDWQYYYDDLACWMATQAEKYFVGSVD